MTHPYLYEIQYTNRSGEFKPYVPPISSEEQTLEQVVETARALKPLTSKGRVLVYCVKEVEDL